MPNCPHCNSVYFGDPDACPECRYNFKLGRVVTAEELRKQREAEQARREAMMKERQAQLEREAVVKRENKLKEAEAERERHQRVLDIHSEKYNYLPKNPWFEYKTEIVPDDDDGSPSKVRLNAVLEKNANEGWRLHTALTNELGRNSSTSGAGGFTSGTNSTIDVTILIFERCIKPAEY